MSFQTAERVVLSSNPSAPWFLICFSFFNSNKKMVEILTKIRTKITIIVVENREHYYFKWFAHVKKSLYPYFLIRCWLQLLTSDKRYNYYKVYAFRGISHNFLENFMWHLRQHRAILQKILLNISKFFLQQQTFYTTFPIKKNFSSTKFIFYIKLEIIFIYIFRLKKLFQAPIFVTHFSI